mmetsp:Transcript_1630/g.4902  ORF Transcript_1630/g.4902 Transcript_1630/m.4902 type:complete len:180 (+) Transcript_1630:264-803(+)
MWGIYLMESFCSRFSRAAQVFFHGNARPQIEIFTAESLFLTVVNNLMFGILLVAVVYILAHFLLTAVIVSRLFLVGCWVISDGSPWLNIPVEWLMLLNKQCPKTIHTGEDSKPQCSVCLDGFDVGCVKRRLRCSHEFHASCIEMWFRKANRCPLCLQSIIPCLQDQVLPRLDHANRFWR